MLNKCSGCGKEIHFGDVRYKDVSIHVGMKWVGDVELARVLCENCFSELIKEFRKIVHSDTHIIKKDEVTTDEQAVHL